MNNKSKFNLPLVSLFLRIEIAVPFIFFRFPSNLIVAIFFAVANLLTENKYNGQADIRNRLRVLIANIYINAIALAIAWLIHCKFTFDSKGEVLIDTQKIYAVLLLVVLVPLILIICRCIFCLTDYRCGGYDNPPKQDSKT